MKLITTIVCLLGLAAATVIPERAGPSNPELASVKSYGSRTVDEGVLEVLKPQVQTVTAAIPSPSANNEYEVSVKKVRPRPHGGGNRTPVYMPPAEIMGVTFAQCKARQEQCMTSYVYWKTNDLKLYSICECATHIWEQGCKDWGYDDCTLGIASGGGDDAAPVEAVGGAGGVDTITADTVPANVVPADTVTANVSASNATFADASDIKTNAARSVTKSFCQDRFEQCKTGWICGADPRNCDRLCNCYVGIWWEEFYADYGFGVCMHGHRFQTT